MKQHIRPLALVVVGAVLGWSGATLAGDHEEAPPPERVVAAIEKAYPGAKLGDVDHDDVELSVYQVEVKVGERELDLTLSEEGLIAAVTDEVTAKELPAPVAKQLTAMGAGPTTELTRTEERAGLRLVELPAPRVTYSATVEREGKLHEVAVAADGTVVSDVLADAEDHDDGKDTDEGGSRKGR